MAVEAYNLNPLFSSNIEMIHPFEANATQFRYGTVQSATETFNPTVECQTSPLNPKYNNAPRDCLFHQSIKPAIFSVDSSVTLNNENNPPLLRKRPREEAFVVNPKHCTDPLMFSGQDLSFNIQKDNFDLDRMISSHMERMRMEFEKKRKAQWRKIKESIEQEFAQKLRAKDEMVNHLRKQTHILEEQFKSACVENQIWRDMSQSSEATVKAIRSKIQQVLTSMERHKIDENDAESCCGSNDEDESQENGQWRLAEEVQDKKRMRRITYALCTICGIGKASVLLIPCRHLCLCTVCGSSVHSCPICNTRKNASLEVNLSS